MNKIRVLHCLETLGSGGVEQRRLLLAKYLNSNVYEQAIICTKAVGALPSQLEAAGCSIFPVGSLNHPFDVKTHLKVLKVIKEFKPHIIHGAVFEGITMASICGSLSRVPIIIGEETSDPTNRSSKANLLMKSFSLLNHRMVGVSPAAYSYLVNTIKVDKMKAVLINNGVEPSVEVSDMQKKSLRERFELGNDNFVIGFVGRLFDEYKRVSDLITAFASIIDTHPTARLLIIGDGPDKEKLIKLAERLNITSKIIFAGYQSDTRPFYSIMNLFVLPSLNESFGLVLVEAMFAKIPVIASRVGGIPYIVKEKSTGLLFTPKDVEGLSSHLLYMIENSSKAVDMGRQGYEVAMKEFSADRYVKDVDRFYQSLIDLYIKAH